MNYSKNGRGINLQAEYAVSVTATDSTAVTYEPGQLYVGTGGTVVLITVGADSSTNSGAVTFVNAQSGDVLPVLTTRVLSTGTTASDLLILY